MLVYLLQLGFAHMMGWSWTGIFMAALPSLSMLLPTMLFFSNNGSRVPSLFQRNNNNNNNRGSSLLRGLAIGLAIFLLWTNFWLTVWWVFVCLVAVRFFGIVPDLLNWGSVLVFGTVTLVIAWIMRRIQERYIDRAIGRAIDYCVDHAVDGLFFLAKQPLVWAWNALKWTVVDGFVFLLVGVFIGLRWRAVHLIDGFFSLVTQLFVGAWKALRWTVLSTFPRHWNEQETARHDETAHDWNDHHVEQETDMTYDWNDYGDDDVEQETASYYDWNDEVEQEAAFHTPIVTAKKAPATLRRSARIRGLEPVDYNAVRIDYSMGTH
jgi:hypothetical protein